MNTRTSFPVILLATALLALSTSSVGGGAGTVTGRAVDARGRPIPNVKIWVKPVVTTGLYQTRTDANGRYNATGLPPVGYRVMGWFEKEYNGQRYCLRLGHAKPTEYDPVNPAKGATRDLLWRTSGRIEDMELYSDMGYFGGSVSVMGEGYTPARNQPLEFTLTPTKPLIDGSQGKTLVRKLDANGYILDVPVGVYRVTATMLEGGAKKAVRLGSTSSNLSGAATLEFKGSTSSCVGSSASGVERAYLYWGKEAVTSSAPAGNSGTVFGPNSPSGDGLIPVSAPVTTIKDGMAGTWDGTITMNGGQRFLVRYVFRDTEYGEGFVSPEGDFLECESANNCAKIGEVTSGKRVPGAGAVFTTTLEESGASFQTKGHFEGKTFVGLTDAVFEGEEAVVRLNPR
jgi:Carboxypeptidase regulatory-like domain